MRLDGRFRGSLGFHRLSNGRLETVLPPILAAAASRSRPEPAKVSELPLAPVLCGAGEKSRLALALGLEHLSKEHDPNWVEGQTLSGTDLFPVWGRIPGDRTTETDNG